MATILPFQALRYNTDKISDLSKVMTPPYDIITPKQQREFYDISPYNVIRLEYGMEFTDDTPDNNRYTRAKQDLDKMMREQILMQEDEPAIYIYEQIFSMPDGSKKSCKGIFSLVQLEEFDKKIVLPHEETLSKAKTDRFNLMKATNCNFSQIYCLYLDQKRAVNQILEEKMKQKADISFTAQDGIRQNLWIIKDRDTIALLEKSFADKQLFIADGHHRYETALNYRNYLRESGAAADGLYNYVMMLLVDMEDDGLVVFPTHRMVKDFLGFDEKALLQSVEKYFTVSKIDDLSLIETALQNEQKAFSLYTGKDYFYLLVLRDYDAMCNRLPDKSPAYQGLDVSILHSLILEENFGIDPENMADQKNLVYTRDVSEAIEDVRNGKFQCSFILNATKVSEIKDISLANEKMPQKSTYFYPKVITGLVMNKFI